MSRLSPAPLSAADRYAGGVIGHEVPTEQQRLHLLEQMLDPDTIRTLEQRGIQPWWRCLELGVGSGSIARWLASRCPDGQIIATDIGTTFLAGLSAPNLQVLQHDVVAEDFPVGSFDLIHARWLLMNLPEREEVLTKAVSWLAPGGWLITEEMDLFPVSSSPHPAIRRFIDAFEQLLADSHGADFRWARRRLPAALAEVGLSELGMSASVKHVGDGSPDDAAYRFSMAQLRSGLVDGGLLSEAEYTAALAALDDPAVIDAPFANIAAWGRRPPS
ncbi:MAG TPA: methyltransferase domain-containing protein [Pseudonocardiaceae bacterium]|nr:methyltransferase domain-containing protein [Pseudonocardiaceae bacterium]